MITFKDLEKKRKHANMTRKAVAEKINRTPMNIYHIETGRKSASMDAAVGLADVFHSVELCAPDGAVYILEKKERTDAGQRHSRQTN